jgi:geranylgeranyl pyrophosphate synthase
MTFVSIAELLNINTESMKFNASESVDQYEHLSKVHKKTKNPNVKNLLKEYENKAKKDIKRFEKFKKFAKDNLKEISVMRKKNKKILVS